MSKNLVEYIDSYLNYALTYKNLKSNNMRDKHVHSSYEIYYLSRGSRIFIIENKILNILPGSLVVIAPHTYHQVLNTSDSSYRSFIINFSLNTIPAHLQHKFTKQNSFFSPQYTVMPLQKKEREQCDLLTKRAGSEMFHRATGYENALYGLTLELLTFCQRNYEMLYQTDTEPKPEEATRIEQIIQYINSHYQEDLSLTRLAERFFVSTSYLSRSFRKEAGISLVDYINSVRIQKAISLFVHDGESVAGVAKKSGFSSTQNFNRVFKQITGYPPSYYKKARNDTDDLPDGRKHPLP